MREMSAICQIGVSTAERSIFGAQKGPFRQPCTTKIAMLQETVLGRHSLKTQYEIAENDPFWTFSFGSKLPPGKCVMKKSMTYFSLAVPLEVWGFGGGFFR